MRTSSLTHLKTRIARMICLEVQALKVLNSKMKSTKLYIVDLIYQKNLKRFTYDLSTFTCTIYISEVNITDQNFENTIE